MLALLPLAALGWLYSRLPDRVYLEPGQTLVLPRFAWVEPLGARGSQNVASTRAVGSYQTTLSLGGWLPIKTIRTIVTERRQVTVCGTPFGVKMFSEGALIVGFSDVEKASGGTTNPAKGAGLRLGDRVIRIGATATEDNDAVKAALEAAQGYAVEVVYIRNGEQLQTSLTPIWDESAGQWRAGMWVRDSSAGVGTLTFADEERGTFAGLGHPISDVDTGADFTLLSGEIVPVTVTGVRSASPGTAGELRGEFLSDILGIVTGNDATGLYGRWTAPAQNVGTMLPIAAPGEVHTGDAELWTTLSGRTAQHYTVRIERVGSGGQDANRDLTLRITDPALLSATGGIVQGMSGSPLVQDGKLVGAVTHVLVGTPAKGYGIFADTMLKMAETYNQ